MLSLVLSPSGSLFFSPSLGPSDDARNSSGSRGAGREVRSQRPLKQGQTRVAPRQGPPNGFNRRGGGNRESGLEARIGLGRDRRDWRDWVEP